MFGTERSHRRKCCVFVGDVYCLETFSAFKSVLFDDNLQRKSSCAFTKAKKQYTILKKRELKNLSFGTFTFNFDNLANIGHYVTRTLG